MNLIIQNTNTQNQNQAYIIKYDSNNLVSSVTPICYNANTTNRSGDECFTVAYWQCNYPGHTTDGICTHGNWVGVSVCIDGQGGGGGSSGSGNHGAGGGAGYGGGGAGYNGSIITAPVAPDYTSISLTTTLSLTQAQQDWLNMGSQSIIRKELQIYLFNNLVDNPNGTNNAIAFANWAVTYLMANPSVTMQQFQKWFMMQTEGQDSEYNPTFWDNPNLTFPQQNLPTRVAFSTGIPKNANGTLMTGADNIFNLAGGAVLQARINDKSLGKKKTENTCALKISIALNRSGVVIPNITGETIEGGGTEFTGKYFFLNAKKMNVWMRATFGTNPATATTPYNPNHMSIPIASGGINGQNFPTLPALQNISGIYSIILLNNSFGF